MAQPTTIEDRQARKDLKRVFRLVSTRFETLRLEERRTMINSLMSVYRSSEPPKL